MSEIVKGEVNRAGLHAKIAEPHPIFYKYKDSESREENGELVHRFSEAHPIFCKDSER